MIISDEEEYRYWYRELELHVWDQDPSDDMLMEKVERAVLAYENQNEC